MLIFSLFQLDPIHALTIAASFIVCQISFAVAGQRLQKSKEVNALSLHDRIDLFSRFPSTVHAIMVFLICAYVLVLDYIGDKRMFHNPVFASNDLLAFALSIGIGYFLSDLLIILVYQIPPMLPLICHHIFASWGFTVILLSHNYMWFATYLYLTEGANPWYNLWWFTTKFNLFDRNVNKLFALTFAYSWVVFRLFPCAYIFFHFYHHFEQVYSVELEVFIVLVLNMVFLFCFNYYFFFFGPFFSIFAGESKDDSFGICCDESPTKQIETTSLAIIEEKQDLHSFRKE